MTLLLDAWRATFEPQEEEWTLQAQEHEQIEIPAIWGGKIDRPVAARKLDKDECAIRIYLHEATNLDFPVEEKFLYPIFYSVVRRAMNEIVKQAFEQQETVEKDDAVRILMKEWKESVKPEHSQHDLFLTVAKDYTETFAEQFVPEKGSVKFLYLSLEDFDDGAILLDLVCAYQIDDNAPIALLFRPEGFKGEDLRENGLLWSALSGKKRASFALLRTIESNLQPKIFSGEDGRFYDYQWNSRLKNLDVEISRLKEKRAALAENRFITQVKDYNCKKCPQRIGCPHYIKSLN